MIHVWAITTILSFSPDTSRSPIHTLSTHRDPITALACGHSSSTANIAVSISQDKSAIIWNYHNGQALRTYLLPESPTALALDPADRAFHVAYEDGSLQTISFFDEVQQSTPVDVLRSGSLSHQPVQPSAKTRFNADSQKLGGASSLSLSWDGTTLISGHTGGKVAAWDIAKGNYISTLTNLPGPVTNLQFLAPTGFPNAPEPKVKIHTVIKPKQDLGSASNTSGLIPPNYSLSMQLTGRLSMPSISATEKRREGTTEFEEALTHPSFPLLMLEESLAELETWNAPLNNSVAPAADFLSFSATERGLEEGADSSAFTQDSGKGEEVDDLKKQLASLQRIQKVTFSQLSSLREENAYFHAKEKKRAKRKRLRVQKALSLTNGNADADSDVEMSEGNSAGRSTASESESDDMDEEEEDNNEDKSE